MSKIVSIHRVQEKHGSIERLIEGILLANYGLDGDWRSSAGKLRQVTFIEQSNLDVIAQELGIVIPPGVHRRQITTDGIYLDGKTIRIGDAVIRIDGPCDPCRKMETAVGVGAKLAMKGRGGIVGTVIVSGTIREGDEIVVRHG